MTTNNIARFARVFAVAGFSVLSLAACAADSEDATDESTSALANNGGGPNGNSFSCDTDTDVCTCDKSIEGDCESMGSICTPADLPGLEGCISGWLTTGCTCHAQLLTKPKKPPVIVAPIFGSSGGIRVRN